jgi:hypothetical protein
LRQIAGNTPTGDHLHAPPRVGGTKEQELVGVCSQKFAVEHPESGCFRLVQPLADLSLRSEQADLDNLAKGCSKRRGQTEGLVRGFQAVGCAGRGTER